MIKYDISNIAWKYSEFSMDEWPDLTVSSNTDLHDSTQ